MANVSHSLGSVCVFKCNVANVSHNLESVYVIKCNVANVSHSLGSVCVFKCNVANVSHNLGSVCVFKCNVANVSHSLGSVCAFKCNVANVTLWSLYVFLSAMWSVFCTVLGLSMLSVCACDHVLHGFGPVHNIKCSMANIIQVQFSPWCYSLVRRKCLQMRCGKFSYSLEIHYITLSDCNGVNFLTVWGLTMPSCVIWTMLFI